MRAWIGALLLCVALLAVGTGRAFAHTKSETHSSWQIVGAMVHLTFTTPEIELKRLAQQGRAPNDAQLGAYLAAHLGARSHGGDCPRTSGPEPSSSEPGYRRTEFTFQCPDTKDITLRDNAFFSLVPTHVNFAQIQIGAGDFIEQLFTDKQQTLNVSSSSGGELRNASFFEYVRLGMMHIFTGADHMSFLVGLVLISRRLRDLTFVVTGFTIGHSITLALAVTGVIRPHAEFIDALVALTIALIGIENVGVATQRPAVVALAMLAMLVSMAGLKLMGIGVLPSLLLLGAGLFSANYLMISGRLRDAGRLRLVVTLVFGLVHGFGFASDLLEMKLPTGRLAELLVGFNLGVELGQLSLVLALTLAVFGLSKLKLTLPRAIVVDVVSAGLVGIGMFWFIGRSF
jgi:hypothetical protein